MEAVVFGVALIILIDANLLMKRPGKLGKIGTFYFHHCNNSVVTMNNILLLSFIISFTLILSTLPGMVSSDQLMFHQYPKFRNLC